MSNDELVQEVVHEMKDVLNGITSLNLLGSEQRLLPTPTYLILRNADENVIDEIDESQGVNSTLDKSHASLSGQFVKSARKNIRSLPLKNVQDHTNEPKPKPSVKHKLCSQYKNSPKYFQGHTVCQQRNLFTVSK